MAWTLPVVGGYRTSAYGPRSSPGGIGSTTHRGVDVGGRGTDWLVRSVGPGYVLARGTNAVRGRWVAVRHDDGSTTAYQHLDEVRASGRVEGGAVLGVMGTTGSSTARHLHLEVFPAERFVRVGDAFASTDRAIDPEPYLRDRGVDLHAGAVTVADSRPIAGGVLPTVAVRPATPITPLPEEDDPMRYLIQIDPGTDGRWFLVDYAAGTAQRIHNGAQLDLIRRDPRVNAVVGPQARSILAGLRITGE